MNVYLGVDVGGTTTAAGLVAPDGRTLHHRSQPTHAPGNHSTLERLLDLATAMAEEARARGARLVGIGVGVPGIVDWESGTMTDAHHVPALNGVAIAARLDERLGAPAFADNDVNALALGEWLWGAGRGARSLVVLAIGTGVGGGLVLGGQLHRGAGGFGGEFGHVPVDLDGPPCICGARGCLKAHVAGPDLAAAASRDREQPIDAASVFTLAARGDAGAQAVLDRALEALAAGLTIIVNGLNPERLLIAGSVGRAFARHEADLRGRLGRRAYPGALASTRISFLEQGKDTSFRGAAALAVHELARRNPDAASPRP